MTLSVAFTCLITLASSHGSCNSDARFDGADVAAIVSCLVAGGSDCGCWDVNDDGTVESADIALLVTILLGDVAYGVNDRFAMPFNTQIIGNVLGNDLDPHGPGATAALASPPAQGTLNLSPNGSMTYMPASGVSGLQSFTYVVVSSHGVSSPAIVYLHTCSATTANCDANPRNGCESSTLTLSNCGACGIPCMRTNATATCNTGNCQIASCNTGYSSCDSIDSNGCEKSHSASLNSCISADDVGTACGDTSIGFLCLGTTSFSTFASRSGNSAQWFRGRSADCSNCAGSLQARITLLVPAGINYDLYVYSACGTPWTSSQNGTGVTEQILLSRPDNSGIDDEYSYWVEVRWIGGASCANWTLTCEGRS